MKRDVVTLSGRVQGVGFREQVLWVARRFPVAGTVRNLADGRLEIDVEGDDGEVDAFVQSVIGERPRLARVDGVERTSEAPRGMRGFHRLPTG